MMKKWIVIGVTFLAWNNCVQAAPALMGDLVQGGLVWGDVPPGTSIILDGENILVHATGRFVFGFGRDAAEKSVLDLKYPDGNTEQTVLKILPRTFDIEHVNGLPPKTVTPPPEWTERRKLENARVSAARSMQTDDLFWAEGFVRPAEGRFSGFYGSQRILNGEPRSPHYGLDIAADTGTPIHAPAGGVVRLAASDFLLEGGIVIIDHGLGVTSTLFHMNTVDVREGQQVKRGEPIGTIGEKGRASGPHVDWRVNWRAVRLDPFLVIAEGKDK